MAVVPVVGRSGDGMRNWVEKGNNYTKSKPGFSQLMPMTSSILCCSGPLTKKKKKKEKELLSPNHNHCSALLPHLALTLTIELGGMPSLGFALPAY